MRVVVYATAPSGEERAVAAFEVKPGLSPFALGRTLYGRQEAPLGWLGRALEDGRAIEEGRDPERASERAMRFTTRPPYVGHGIEGCLRSARIDREEIDTLGADDAARRIELAQSARSWEARAVELAGSTMRKYAREWVDRVGHEDQAQERLEAVMVANGYSRGPTLATLARLLILDAAQRRGADDDERRD